jgi:cyclophilin family peptidyl-prolyl cis-trans isomerase/HEAT repeat protein
MRFISSRAGLVPFALAALTAINIAGQSPGRAGVSSRIPTSILLQIIRAEDERRWDDQLDSLLSDKDAQIRTRAALAAGRIGDERAISPLVRLLRDDADANARQMTAFAIGEIESPLGADALLEVLGYKTATSRGNERVDGSSGGVRANDGDEAQARAIEANGAVARPLGRASEVTSDVRARAVEALGKIAAALPDSDKDRRRIYGEAILKALRFEHQRRSRPDHLTILLGLTAALRAKPDGTGPVIARFVSYADSRIVADALNALARLRLKDGNDQARELLVKSSDPIVRANAARLLGATEDKQAFETLLDRALHDSDLRVRVSAIRALGSLKDAHASKPLLRRAQSLLIVYRGRKGANPSEKNELLEIATTLGRILQNSNNAEAVAFLERFRILDQLQSPETEIAFARISPETYLRTVPLQGTPKQIDKIFPMARNSWRTSTNLAQGLGEFAKLPNSQKELRQAALADFGIEVLSQESHEPAIAPAISDALRTFAAFKNDVNDSAPISDGQPRDRLTEVLRGYVTYKPKSPPEPFRIVPPDHRTLGYNDVFVRATAAELLGEQRSSKENTEALVTALSQSLKFDTHDNDAALAILDALAKQKNDVANAAIKTALESSDHLIRRKAVALLRANGAGDFSNRIGTVKTRYTDADYRRAIARIGKQVTATVETSKGSFVIEFLPEDAPLTVDNFIQLAKRGFFNGQTIPRVVPNFVIQAGDPRGDTNGGPGYQIRCEINEVPYERGTVGMALSGKDTGGSQWFVTHSPQPHLDGGYTVFGHVIRGMEVVDNIARGDVIRRVIVSER